MRISESLTYRYRRVQCVGVGTLNPLVSNNDKYKQYWQTSKKYYSKRIHFEKSHNLSSIIVKPGLSTLVGNKHLLRFQKNNSPGFYFFLYYSFAVAIFMDIIAWTFLHDVCAVLCNELLDTNVNGRWDNIPFTLGIGTKVTPLRTCSTYSTCKLVYVTNLNNLLVICGQDKLFQNLSGHMLSLCCFRHGVLLKFNTSSNRCQCSFKYSSCKLQPLLV